MIPCPVSSINNVDTTLPEFFKWINSTVKKFRVCHLTGERFQPRGISRGNTTELIGMMYGAILAAKLPIQLILPATWKNQVNRQFDLKAMYYSKKGNTPYLGEPHELDATLIAMYGGYTTLAMKPTYHGIDKNRLISIINERSSSVSTRKRVRAREKEL